MASACAALASLLVVYREAPALAGAPVFSNDAWPLLADASYLLRQGSAHLIPCSGVPTCYYAYWPNPALITVMVERVTGLSLLWVPADVTAWLSVLFASSTILFAARVLRRRGRGADASGVSVPGEDASHQTLPAFALLLITASWLSQIFYSGYKAEAFAVPVFVTILYFALRPEASGEAYVKRLGVCLTLFYAVLATHHYTTYVAAATLAGYYGFRAASDRLRGGVRGLARYAALPASAAAMAALYYAAQGFKGVTQYYPPGFTSTIAAYNLLILAAVWYASSLGVKARTSVTALLVAAALAAPAAAPSLTHLFPGTPRLTSAEELLLVEPAALAALASAGSYTLLARGRRTEFYALSAWAAAPLSLTAYSFFDGANVLLGRGLISASIPLSLLGAVYLAHVYDEYRAGRRRVGAAKTVVAALVLAVAVSATVAGYAVEAGAVFGARNVYTGSTWFFPAQEVTYMSAVSGFEAPGTTVSGGLRATALAFYFNAEHSDGSAASNTTGAAEVYVLSHQSLEGYPFGFSVSEAYVLRLFSGGDLVFASSGDDAFYLR